MAFEVIGSSANRAAWLDLRRAGIGGSDAPAILGLVGWASPASIQADKWGLSDEPDDAEILRWGRRLEPAIIEGLAEETGIELIPDGRLLRSVERPLMLCTPDAVTPDGTVFAQVKNTTQADDWNEGVPERVYVQCQHEMAVTGAPRMIAAALIFGNRCRWEWVDRDDSFIESVLIPAEEDFWRAVEEREPVVDGSEHTKRALQHLYPEDSGATIALDASFVALEEERAELAEVKRTAQTRMDAIDNEIRAAMKDATFGALPNGSRYSLKTTTRKAYTVESKTFRTLRRSKGKA